MKIPGITTERLTNIFSIRSRIQQTTDCFNVKAIANNSHLNRIAIISGKKKLGKSAVYRNRADRRLRAAVRSVYPQVKLRGYDFVFYLQPLTITAPWVYLLDKVAGSFEAMEQKAAGAKRKPNRK